MENLLVVVIPYLETFRTFVMNFADLLGRLLQLEANNIYLFLMVVLSLWSSKKILEFFYTTLEGREGHRIVLAIILFWVLKILGAN